MPVLDLCRACEHELPCAAPAVRTGPGPVRLCCAPFEYGPPLDHLVQALKYRGQLAAGRVLGSLLGRRIEALGLVDGVDVLVPVPLHPLRHAKRSYNQSAEIAWWVSQQVRRPANPDLAIRRRATSPQVGLALHERQRNVRAAFRATSGLAERHVVVVDDVTTTGSTLIAVATALLDAGAAAVDAWCVARVERRGS